MEKYSTILFLDRMLNERGIPHELVEMFDGYKIGYPEAARGACVCSVIEHQYSYGHEVNCLEIKGLLTTEESQCDKVRGYMTANEVFRRIERDWLVRDIQPTKGRKKHESDTVCE